MTSAQLAQLNGSSKRGQLSSAQLNFDLSSASSAQKKFSKICNSDQAGWTEILFEDGKVKVSAGGSHNKKTLTATSLQKKILDENPSFLGRKIFRSDLKEEYGSWILDRDLQENTISAGGEAIVLKQKFGEFELAVRVQAFDSAVFAEREELKFNIHLSKGKITYSKSSQF